MTAIVGILNRRGVAIAADSAVTRSVMKESDSPEEKVTKNGNKIVRLSDADHICVLITGNAYHLGVPWDVIVRRYRQLEGKKHSQTVEEAARSFFDFMASGTKYSERFWDKGACAETGLKTEPSILIFVGYGQNQDYPSLVSAKVCGGQADRVNYSIQDVTCISDEKPVAICPFAQTDVISTILHGISDDWYDEVKERLNAESILEYAFRPYEWEEKPELDTSLFREELEKLFGDFSFRQKVTRSNSYSAWEKALDGYDLEEMASLADSLIDLTGFQRVLTFRQEGVGGPVDLAVISKNEGFTWLRRKGWYRIDAGGKDCGC